jgi:hypothetical protein
LLLALASTVILGSESCGTREYILVIREARVVKIPPKLQPKVIVALKHWALKSQFDVTGHLAPPPSDKIGPLIRNIPKTKSS